MPNLTLKKCHSAPPGKHGDGQYGLFLYVKASGTRSWIQAVRVNGKRTDLGLGKFPVVKLTEARDQALENVRTIRRGDDPRRPAAEGTAITFGEAAEIAIHEASHHMKDPAKYAKTRLALLTNHACPKMGGVPVADVGTAEVKSVLSPLAVAEKEWGNVANAITKVLDWALLEGHRAAANPVPLVSKSLPKRKTTHHRSLHYEQLPAAITRIMASKSNIAVKTAILLEAVTGCRVGSACEATWDEMDLDAGIWTSRHMKSKKNGDSVFRYPLPTQVVDALKTLPRRTGNVVFSVTKGKPVSTSTPLKVLTRCGLDATAHGFRSSLTGWAANNGCPKDIQEALMAHKESALRQAYMRDDLLEVRRRWHQQWADYLLTPPKRKRKPATLDAFVPRAHSPAT